MQKLNLYVVLLLGLLSTPVYAYIGPGAGAGTIAIVFGVIASIFLALIAIVWYPLKRLINSRKKQGKKAEETLSDSE